MPLGPIFVVGQVGENTATRVGDTHTGSGKVESLTAAAAAAATATSDLCAGCELTCQFNGYQTMSIDPTDVKFTGRLDRPVPGLRHQQRRHHGEHTGGSAADLIEATNGTLFPSLTEHDIDAPGNTVVGKGASVGSTFPTGFGTGPADLDTSTTGNANAYFDTNRVPAAFGNASDRC